MVYKTPKHVEEMKENKRKLILEAAARVFSCKGYHGTTVKDIVDEAGISVGSFYFYFKSKDAIFINLFDEILNQTIVTCDLEVAKESTLEEQIRVAITTLFKIIMECRDLAKIMMIDSAGVSQIEGKRFESVEIFAQHINVFLEEGIRQGVLPEQDAKTVAYAYSGAVYNVISHWLTHAEPENLLDAAPALIKFNLRGIGLAKD